jgi:O-antigen/teichoic acid export membrane protein
VAIRLVDYAISFLTQATSMTGPIFTEYYAKEQWEELRTALVRFIRLDFVLGAVAILGFYLVGELFIRLWMGAEFPAREAWVCLVILAAGRMSVYISSPLQSLLMTFNKHRTGAMISVVETVVIAISCAIFIPSHGIVGASLSVAIPTVIGRFIVLPCYCQHVFKFMSFSLLFRLVAFVVCLTVVPAVFWQLNIVEESSFQMLLVQSLLIVAVTVPLAFVVLNRAEFGMIANRLRRRAAK